MMTTISELDFFNTARTGLEIYMDSIRGTIYQRKARGRKLEFCICGPSLMEAANMIKWDKAAGFVFEFQGDDGWCSLVPPRKEV